MATIFTRILFALLIGCTIATVSGPIAAQDEAPQAFDQTLPAGEVSDDPLLEPRPITGTIETDAVQTQSYEGDESGGLPQFDVTTFTSQIFWLGVTFAILYFYFSKKALPSLSAIMEARKSTIRNDLDQADRLSTQIDDARARYDAIMQDAARNAAAARAAMEQDIKDKAAEQARLFNHKSMEAVESAETRSSQQKQAIMKDIEGVASDIASAIVAKLANLDAPADAVRKAVAHELAAETQRQTNTKRAA